MDEAQEEELGWRTARWSVSVACNAALGFGSTPEARVEVTAFEVPDHLIGRRLEGSRWGERGVGPEFELGHGPRPLDDIDDFARLCSSYLLMFERWTLQVQQLDVSSLWEFDESRLVDLLWEWFPMPVLGSPPSDWTTVAGTVASGGVLGGIGLQVVDGGVSLPVLALVAGGSMLFARLVLPPATAAGEELGEEVRHWFSNRRRKRESYEAQPPPD